MLTIGIIIIVCNVLAAVANFSVWAVTGDRFNLAVAIVNIAAIFLVLSTSPFQGH